jgi:hypothetical protein
MKLSECTFGRMVIDDNLNVGHVVGVTYNISLQYTGGMTQEDKFNRTIPLVKFADGERGI